MNFSVIATGRLKFRNSSGFFLASMNSIISGGLSVGPPCSRLASCRLV